MKNSDFPIIQSELDAFDDILVKVRTLSTADFEHLFYMTLGIALIQAQRIEFAMLGIIAHIDEELLKKDKSFKGLNPQRFLSPDAENNQYRKQTLGVLVSFFKKEINFFSAEELEQYLQMRNILIHNFWRQYLSHSRTSLRDKMEEALKFVVQFQKSGTIWDSIFKGFMYSVGVYLAKLENQNLPEASMLASFKVHEATFLASAKVQTVD